MKTLIFFICILLIIVAWLIVALIKARKENEESKAERNKDKIMSLFETDVELTNTEIRNALGVSDRTVVRYMDALEKAGLVIQTRKTGPLTAYILKK
jgi:predicted HTH transcriptional regulator